MNEKIEPLYMDSQAKWRQWLSKNHDKIEFVWLALKKKNSEKKGVIYSEAVEEALCYGWIDGQVKRFDEDYYIQRFNSRKKNSLWSKINKDKALGLIKENKMTNAGLYKIEEAKENGNWKKAYSSPKNIDIPNDLILALNKNPAAFKAFFDFAPSHQKLYALWLNDAKREDTRKKRIEKIIIRSLQKMKPGML